MKKKIFPVRVTENDQNLIKNAAQQERESISSFYVRSALLRAGHLKE